MPAFSDFAFRVQPSSPIPPPPNAALPLTMPEHMLDLGYGSAPEYATLPDSPTYVKLPIISPFMIQNNNEDYISRPRVGTVDAYDQEDKYERIPDTIKMVRARSMGIMRPIRELPVYKTACPHRLDWPNSYIRYHLNDGYRVKDDGCCTIGARDEAFGVGKGTLRLSSGQTVFDWCESHRIKLDAECILRCLQDRRKGYTKLTTLEREFNNRFGRAGMWRDRNCPFATFLACFEKDFVVRDEPQGKKARLGDDGHLRFEDDGVCEAIIDQANHRTVDRVLQNVNLMQTIEGGIGGTQRGENVKIHQPQWLSAFGSGLREEVWEKEKREIAAQCVREHKYMFGAKVDGSSSEDGESPTGSPQHNPRFADQTMSSTTAPNGATTTIQGTVTIGGTVETIGGTRTSNDSVAYGAMTANKNLHNNTMSTKAPTSLNNTLSPSLSPSGGVKLPPLGHSSSSPNLRTTNHSHTNTSSPSPRRGEGQRSISPTAIEEARLHRYAVVKAPKNNSGVVLTPIERVMTNLARLQKPYLMVYQKNTGLNRHTLPYSELGQHHVVACGLIPGMGLTETVQRIMKRDKEREERKNNIASGIGHGGRGGLPGLGAGSFGNLPSARGGLPGLPAGGLSMPTGGRRR